MRNTLVLRQWNFGIHQLQQETFTTAQRVFFYVKWKNIGYINDMPKTGRYQYLLTIFVFPFFFDWGKLKYSEMQRSQVNKTKGFNEFLFLYNQHTKSKYRLCPSPQKIPLCSNLTGNHHSNVYHHKSVLSLLEHHMNGIMHHILICIWCLSLNKHNVFEIHAYCCI